MLYIYLRFTRPHSSVPSIIKRECICNCIRFSMQTQKKKQIMKERKKENKIHHHFRRMSGGLSIIGHLLHRSFATATEYLSHIYTQFFFSCPSFPAGFIAAHERIRKMHGLHLWLHSIFFSSLRTHILPSQCDMYYIYSLYAWNAYRFATGDVAQNR